MPDSPRPHRHLSGLKPEALMAQGLSAEDSVVDLYGIEIITRLGSGGMGTVYLGRQVSLDREVAVKVLTNSLAGDPLFIERLEREARVMARLRHPNIVAVHDFQRSTGSAAIVMEFVEGGNLRGRLRQHPKGLPGDEALRILSQIAAGLEAAHASGVIHRDMKPENVLIDDHGTARVTDFGLALPMHEGSARLTLTGTTVGTVDYMAPEQFKDVEPDVRLDVFALGVIAYELLTGHTPRGSFDPPHRLRPEIPLSVSEAIMRALRPEPSERFASMSAFIQAMSRTATRRSIVPWLVMLMAAAILIAAVWAAGNFWRTNPGQPMSEASLSPWRDAIAGTRIYEDVIGGDWKNEDGVLTSNDQICVVALEYELPESYDVRMKFTRIEGKDSVALFIRANTTTGSAELDAWSEGLAGVQLIGGEDLTKGYGFRFPLENGRSYDLLVEVRRNLVRMSVDGVFQKEFDLDGKFIHPPAPWAWDSVARPAALALGSYMSPTRFEKVEWRAVKQP